MPDEGWRSPANRIALGSLIIALLALVISLLSWVDTHDATKSGRVQADTGLRESERRGALEFSDVGSRFGKVDGKITSEAGTKDLPGGITAPQIDLIFRNRGSGESRIDQVEVTVRRSHQLEGCHGTGEGLKVSANYEVALPLDQDPLFTKVRPLDFIVGSGEYDRFSLILGPEGDLATPWVGVVELRFRADDGDDLNVGPIALIAPGDTKKFRLEGTSWTIDPAYDKACQRRNAEIVSDVRRTPDLVEPSALASLEQALLESN